MKTFVGPVRGPGQAVEFADAGTSCVCVALSRIPRFDDGLVSTVAEAKEVKEVLHGCDFGLILRGDESDEAVAQSCSHLSPTWVLADIRLVRSGFSAAVARHGIRLALFGLSLDYDEDPDWTRGQATRALREFAPALCVVTVLPSIPKPVSWLREERGRFDDEVCAGDLEALLRELPIAMNIRVGEPWTAEFLRVARSASGCVFFLGCDLNDGGSPCLTSVPTLLDTIRMMRGPG